MTDNRFVLGILKGGPVRLYNAVDLVYGTMQPPRCYETGKLARVDKREGVPRTMSNGNHTPVDETDAHTERSSEAIERKATIRLKELIVRENAHLAHVEARVWREYAVRFQVGLLKGGFTEVSNG